MITNYNEDIKSIIVRLIPSIVQALSILITT